MKDIQLKELLRSVKFIGSLGCQFKIITPDGDEYGQLEVAPMKAPRSKSGLPHGELTNFAKANLDINAEVGSVQEVFVPAKYVPSSVQSIVCYILTRAWGKDNYTTCLNKKTMCIEILRTAKGE